MKVNPFKLFQTSQSDPVLAAQEFYEKVFSPKLELAVFFCSSNYDLEALAREIHRLFADVLVVGCTTAGEIGPAGILRSGLVGVGFPAGSCKVVSGLISNLKDFDIPQGYAFAQGLLQQLERSEPNASSANSFAFTLIDGLSIREEVVAHTLQMGLDRIPIVGGSAADDHKISQTYVYHGGKFHTKSAVLTIITTHLPFKLFHTQHIVSTDKRMVVTEADASRRIVKEIDGFLAAEAYAQAIGMDIRDLNSEVFAANPVVVVLDGQEYVRTIQKVNEDGSLTFFCAIDEGIVFRLAKPGNLKRSLSEMYQTIRQEIGQPHVTLTFDCFERALDAERRGDQDAIIQFFRENNAVGFYTYGEQFKGVHLNQTMTGVAIGERRHEQWPGKKA